MEEPQDKEIFMTFCIAFGQQLCGTPNPDAVSLLNELKENERFKNLWDYCKQITIENNFKGILK